MKYAFLATLVLLPPASGLSADNWPAWRGPHFNGVADGAGYPVQWGSEQNVAWKAELPGRGGSTPIVWNDAIFVTSGDEGHNALLRFDRQGQLVWKTQIGNERPGKHRKGTGSNPSPTTDGQHVFVYYKSGDLACLDFDGKIVWHLNLQDEFGADTLWWDLGTSPVLTDKLLVVACIHSGPSYLLGVEKGTGKVAWKQDRNLDAPNESLQTYSTPIPAEVAGRSVLVVLGADHVTGHDAASGEELWRVGGLNPEGQGFFRSIASPVVDEGIAVAPYARGRTLTAIRLGGSGDVTRSHVAWSKDGLSADVPTPAALDGRIYVCTDRGEVACLDIRSGDELWKIQAPRSGSAAYSASPIVADNKLYVTREDGMTTVISLGDEPQVVGENRLDEFTVATPAFVDGQILLRTEQHLYCIGK
jgi:outer membrane protein assembly factor BamB